MLQSGERSGVPSVFARAATVLWLKSRLVADEVLVGSPVLTRIALVGMAIALQTFVIYSPGHFRPAPNLFFAVLTPAATLASLALCLVATLPVKRLLGVRQRQLLSAAALGILGILALIGTARGANSLSIMAHRTPYNNDGAVMDLYAAERALLGHDPYMKTNIVTALAGINAPSTTVTPLMDGQFRGARAYPSDEAVQQAFLNVLRYRPRTIPPEFESKYNYPAGSFLFILPFVWAGIHDMRFLYALAIVGIGVYLWHRMPRSLRWLVLVLLAADVPVIASATGGQPDPLYGLFLVIGYAEWRRPWVSPIGMGLAVSIKQLAWFFMPFYLLVVARQLGKREAIRRCMFMGTVFLVLNGPFILQSPSSYLSSVMAPMIDPMFPLGCGIIALFVADALPMLPKMAFTLAEVGALGAAVGIFARFRWLSPASGVVLATLPLFFAWRSLTTYFYLAPLLSLAVVLGEIEHTRESAGGLPRSAAGPSTRPRQRDGTLLLGT